LFPCFEPKNIWVQCLSRFVSRSVTSRAAPLCDIAPFSAVARQLSGQSERLRFTSSVLHLFRSLAQWAGHFQSFSCYNSARCLWSGAPFLFFFQWTSKHHILALNACGFPSSSTSLVHPILPRCFISCFADGTRPHSQGGWRPGGAIDDSVEHHHRDVRLPSFSVPWSHITCHSNIGPMIESCDITLTPIMLSNGTQAVEVVKMCILFPIVTADGELHPTKETLTPALNPRQSGPRRNHHDNLDHHFYISYRCCSN
jgi:hypothetical protein